MVACIPCACHSDLMDSLRFPCTGMTRFDLEDDLEVSGGKWWRKGLEMLLGIDGGLKEEGVSACTGHSAGKYFSRC